MKWLREAVSDDAGLADMAYIAIGALTVTAIASLVFIFALTTISYVRCQPITTISKGDQSVTSVIPCNFDPLPVGQSAGLIFGAFSALIGALAGYMAATRKQRPPQGDQTIIARNVGQIAQPAIDPAPAAPPKPKPKGRK